MRDRSSSATSVLLARLILVAIVAAAAATNLVLWRRAATPLPAGEAAPARYVCPMHPQVTATSPGDCPICRMALVPEAAAAPGGSGEPMALTLPGGKRLRGHDAVSRTQVFESNLEMRAPAGADDRETGVALYHLDESELILAGEEGLFSPSSGPRAGQPLGLKVRVLPGPRERWDEATVLVRFAAEPGVALVPHETGLLKLPTRLRKDLVVSESAIFHSPAGPYVLVTSDRGTFSKRSVEIGTMLYGQAAVVSGLRRGEHAVATHTFVLDLERRSQRRAGP
jgi:hypothetical protein